MPTGWRVEIQLAICSPRYAPARGLDSPRGMRVSAHQFMMETERKFPALPYMYHPYMYNSSTLSPPLLLCVYKDNSEKDPTGQETRVSLDTEGTRCRLAGSLRCPNRPLHAGQGSQIKPRGHHRPVELLHSTPKCCHYSKYREPPGQAEGAPAEIQLLLTKLCLEFCCFLRPGLAPLCIEISGHQMVSDAELWPGLV